MTAYSDIIGKDFVLLLEYYSLYVLIIHFLLWAYQVVQNCPKDFLEVDNFAYLATELCLTFLYKLLLRYLFIILYVVNLFDS